MVVPVASLGNRSTTCGRSSSCGTSRTTLPSSPGRSWASFAPPYWPPPDAGSRRRPSLGGSPEEPLTPHRRARRRVRRPGRLSSRSQAFCLLQQFIVALIVNGRLKIFFGHQPNQYISLFHIFFEFLVKLPNAYQAVVGIHPAQAHKQRFEYYLMPEDELVHHGYKGVFKIGLPDIFHRACIDVRDVGGAAPCNVFFAAGVDSAFEGAVALAADDFPRKWIAI